MTSFFHFLEVITNIIIYTTIYINENKQIFLDGWSILFALTRL